MIPSGLPYTSPLPVQRPFDRQTEKSICNLLSNQEQFKRGLSQLNANKDKWKYFSGIAVARIINSLSKHRYPEVQGMLQVFSNSISWNRTRCQDFKPQELAMLANGISKCSDQKIKDQVYSQLKKLLDDTIRSLSKSDIENINPLIETLLWVGGPPTVKVMELIAKYQTHRGLDKTTIDLHNLSHEGALLLVKYLIDNKQPFHKIIVGRGSHRVGSGNPMGEIIEELLRENGVLFRQEQNNPGMLIVNSRPQKAPSANPSDSGKHRLPNAKRNFRLARSLEP